MIDLKAMSYDEMAAFMKDHSQPSYRTDQLFSWLHEKQAAEFSSMTNLPKSLLETLEKNTSLVSLFPEQKLVSKLDGTVKYLFRLPDGEFIESVVMRYEHGLSACLSTQVGCRMGCSFCASTKAGFVRNLRASEILEQVYFIQRDLNERISSIVLMGIGEPLDNYDNVLRFLELLSSPRGNNLSLRHVSLSTCGLVDKIYELAELKLGLTLSISLHAPNDAVRTKLMPIAKKYSMAELLEACRYYIQKTGRRISFEYALISGVNDSFANASELAQKLHGMLCHVNLIPVNEIKETSFRNAGREHIYEFQAWLIKKGLNATIRRTLGADISAACGQLRAQTQVKEGLA